MRLASLFSGGKDSTFAVYKAKKDKHDIVCLLTVYSQNPDSYMFHTVNIRLVKLQAKLMKLPLLSGLSGGEKERELDDLKALVKHAVNKYCIQGLCVGALASNYQKERVEALCNELGLALYSPFWQVNPEDYMNELIGSDFNVIITKISADGLTEDFLGKRIDKKLLQKLKDINSKTGISIVGEGGEYETLVLNCPLFERKLRIVAAHNKMESYNVGFYVVEKAE